MQASTTCGVAGPSVLEPSDDAPLVASEPASAPASVLELLQSGPEQVSLGHVFRAAYAAAAPARDLDFYAPSPATSGAYSEDDESRPAPEAGVGGGGADPGASVAAGRAMARGGAAGSAPLPVPTAAWHQAILFLAAESGDVAAVKWLVGAGEASVTARDRRSRTPLRVSCVHGAMPVVRFLATHPATGPLQRALSLNPCVSRAGRVVERVRAAQRAWNRAAPLLLLRHLCRSGRAQAPAPSAGHAAADAVWADQRARQARIMAHLASRGRGAGAGAGRGLGRAGGSGRVASGPFFDAHCHMHLARIEAHAAAILRAARRAGVVRLAVNAVGEGDWPRLEALLRSPFGGMVAPQFGIHPWAAHRAAESPGWEARLEAVLRRYPDAGVGEAGLHFAGPLYRAPGKGKGKGKGKGQGKGKGKPRRNEREGEGKTGKAASGGQTARAGLRTNAGAGSDGGGGGGRGSGACGRPSGHCLCGGRAPRAPPQPPVWTAGGDPDAEARALRAARAEDQRVQVEVLRAQLRIAARLGRPISLHSVGKGAMGRLRELIQEQTDEWRRGCGRVGPPVVLHSYAGSGGMVPALVAAGAGRVYFSFGGAALSPAFKRVRAAVPHVPLDRLLVETDAPDQLPRVIADEAASATGGAVHGRARNSGGGDLSKAGATVPASASAAAAAGATASASKPKSGPYRVTGMMAARAAQGINEPAHMERLVHEVARIVGLPERTVEEAVFANAVRVFGDGGGLDKSS